MVGATCSIVLIALAPSLALLVAAFAVLGGACGLCDVSGNTLVMWSRPEGPGALLNALHLCFAIGAMVTPIIVNRSLHLTDSIWGVALPMAALTAVCAALMLPHPSPARTRLATVERSHAGGARGTQVAVICAFFFAYVAMETGFINWIHTYVEQIEYGGAATATGVTSMFGLGFTAGRVLAIWVARHVSPLAGLDRCRRDPALRAVVVAVRRVRRPGPDAVGGCCSSCSTARARCCGW